MRLVLVVALSIASNAFAAQVANDRFGFSVVFPDSAGWSEVEEIADSPGTRTWRSANPSARLGLVFMASTERLPDSRPTFRENAEVWAERADLPAGELVSARFTMIAKREAKQIVQRIQGSGQDMFLARWMIDGGHSIYFISVAAGRIEDLESSPIEQFLASVEIGNRSPVEER